MSFQVTTAFVKQFGNTITLLSQQKGSRLSNAVYREDAVRGEEVYMDQIGSTAAQRVTTRHGDSPLVSTPHDRRQISMIDVEWGDLVDDFDKLKMVIDPTSAMSMNAGNAIGREIDSIIIEQFFATANTGKAGGTSTAFDSNNVVAVDFNESAAAGMTVAKLREARRILRANEALGNGEPVYIAVTAEQLDDLLATTEVTSRDYNTVQALVDGEINKYLGFIFIHTELLETDTNSYRRVPVWVKTGMGLAVAKNPTSRIAERADKRFSTYIYYCTSVGSSRLEEAKVVEIKCSEA